MAKMLIDAFKPTILEYIERARVGLPGTLDNLVADVIEWLPTQVAPLVGVANRLLDWLKVRAQAL